MKEKSPSLVFLMETKLTQHKAGFLKTRLGFDNIFIIDCRGRSGGLILLWNSSSNVTILNFSQSHINVEIKSSGNGLVWKLTGFYGHPDPAKGLEASSLLKFLS